MPLLKSLLGVRRYNLKEIAAWEQSKDRWRGIFGKAIISFWTYRKTKPDYVELLWEIFETEQDLAPLVARYSINKGSVANVITELQSGCNIVVQGHYVAASALAFPQTLEMTMSAMVPAGSERDRARVAELKIRLVQIFERGI